MRYNFFCIAGFSAVLFCWFLCSYNPNGTAARVFIVLVIISNIKNGYDCFEL